MKQFIDTVRRPVDEFGCDVCAEIVKQGETGIYAEDGGQYCSPQCATIDNPDSPIEHWREITPANIFLEHAYRVLDCGAA